MLLAATRLRNARKRTPLDRPHECCAEGVLLRPKRVPDP
jgi:hypothetical protein